MGNIIQYIKKEGTWMQSRVFETEEEFCKYVHDAWKTRYSMFGNYTYNEVFQRCNFSGNDVGRIPVNHELVRNNPHFYDGCKTYERDMMFRDTNGRIIDPRMYDKEICSEPVKIKESGDKAYRRYPVPYTGKGMNYEYLFRATRVQRTRRLEAVPEYEDYARKTMQFVSGYKDRIQDTSWKRCGKYRKQWEKHAPKHGDYVPSATTDAVLHFSFDYEETEEEAAKV